MSKVLARYTQVKNYVLGGISDGSWGTGERVPSENELVDLCGVSRMTARRALQELLLEGTLIRIKGKGSFVAQEKQQSSLLQINSIANEIRQQGHSHRSALLELVRETATQEIANAMKMDNEGQIYHSQVLHYQNDVPIQLEHRWVLPVAAMDYINQNFINITPSEYLTRIAPVTEAEHKIEAVIGDTKYRELLQVAADEALLLLKRTTWCGNQLVSFAKLYHPGNRYSFGTRFNQP